MSVVASLAILLVCLLSAGSACAGESAPSIAVLHEATFLDGQIRWDTRVFRCGTDDSDPSTLATKWVPFDSQAPTVRLAPPLLAGASVQVVTFREADRVFVPSSDAVPWRTRNGFEVLHPDPAARDEVIACLRQQHVHLAPTALLVNADSRFSQGGIAGAFVERFRGARALLGVGAAIFSAVLAALALFAHRLVRRTRLEAAERILRADMPDF
jgi:hypothetical protein